MHFDFYFLSILPNNISGQWNIIRTELLKLKCLLMSNMFLCTFFSNVFWLFSFYLIITDTSLIFFRLGHRRSWFTQIVVHASDQIEEPLLCRVKLILMLFPCASVILHCMWVCVCSQTGFIHSVNLYRNMYTVCAANATYVWRKHKHICRDCPVSLSCIIYSQCIMSVETYNRL